MAAFALTTHAQSSISDLIWHSNLHLMTCASAPRLHPLPAAQAHPMYKGTDIYNTCLHRVLLRVNNTGPPGAVLYDLPLGWWDHDWAGCFGSRKAINDSDWRRVAGSFLAMHNRCVQRCTC